MRISDAIRILQQKLETYGDCRLMDFYGFDISEITDFQFIGGQRVIVVSEDKIQKGMLKIHCDMVKDLNRLEKEKWMKDCEGL